VELCEPNSERFITHSQHTRILIRCLKRNFFYEERDFLLFFSIGNVSQGTRYVYCVPRFLTHDFCVLCRIIEFQFKEMSVCKSLTNIYVTLLRRYEEM